MERNIGIVFPERCWQLEPMVVRRHEKTVGRLREETRALRLLTQQAVEERALLAEKILVRT